MITAQVATDIQLRPGEDERSSPGAAAPEPKPAFEVKNLSIWYGQKEAIHDVTIDIPPNNVTAIIGPSGCGKSTFLRCLNRMHELVPNTRVEGSILFQGEDLYSAGTDPTIVRRRIGMVFQKSNPFPTMSIEENVIVGLRLNGLRNRRLLAERTEKALRMSALWDEVKGDLHKPGMSLSGGQQQRLCIARAIAVEPEVLLMDEPASALDPIATMKIEELIRELRNSYTIVIVTHNMQQAVRVSDRTAFFYVGKLIEFDETSRLFSHPKEKKDGGLHYRPVWLGPMIPSRHILQDFGAALDSLRGDVLMMASLSDRNLQNAMSCLLDREAQMCAITLADEEEIDALEKKVDEDGVSILLRFQPVASDLRQVISAMKLSSNIERISDQAVKIAERAHSLTRKPVLEEAATLGPMFIEATTLFRDSVRAYADADVALARSLGERDREIDEMNRHIANDLTVSMTQQPDRISDYLHLLFIARYLERVGDHAKNIGEDAVYAAEAEDIRHIKNEFSAYK